MCWERTVRWTPVLRRDIGFARGARTIERAAVKEVESPPGRRLSDTRGRRAAAWLLQTAADNFGKTRNCAEVSGGWCVVPVSPKEATDVPGSYRMSVVLREGSGAIP